MRSYDPGHFLTSRRGLAAQHGRRRRREIHVDVKQEPRAKGRRGRSDASFREAVATEMTARRRRFFRGPVALELHFSTSTKNPPSIETLAKRYLDLLGAAKTGEPHGRRPALYDDDRQVKLLYVSTHHGWGRDDFGLRDLGVDHQPWVWVRAMPLRDVVVDLELAGDLNLRSGDRDDDDPFEGPRFTDDEDDDQQELVAVEDGSIQAWLVEHARYLRRAKTQESLLGVADAHLLSALCAGAAALRPFGSGGLALPEGASRTLEYRQVREHLLESGILASDIISLPLAGLPTHSEPTRQFARRVEAEVRGFKTKAHWLFPLVCQLRVTLLVTPSAAGKDLDNIMLRVLPIVHRVMQPPAEPWLQWPAPTMGPTSPRRQEALQRLRSLHEHTVTSFQVIEFPRRDDDPPEGHLMLVLGSGEQQHSSWRTAIDYATERLDQMSVE